MQSVFTMPSMEPLLNMSFQCMMSLNCMLTTHGMPFLPQVISAIQNNNQGMSLPRIGDRQIDRQIDRQMDTLLIPREILKFRCSCLERSVSIGNTISGSNHTQQALLLSTNAEQRVQVNTRHLYRLDCLVHLEGQFNALKAKGHFPTLCANSICDWDRLTSRVLMFIYGCTVLSRPVGHDRSIGSRVQMFIYGCSVLSRPVGRDRSIGSRVLMFIYGCSVLNRPVGCSVLVRPVGYIWMFSSGQASWLCMGVQFWLGQLVMYVWMFSWS